MNGEGFLFSVFENPNPNLGSFHRERERERERESEIERRFNSVCDL
jgi:hypothetical protein